ncbi:zinc finger, CCHC-type containing protein [Tanacetum coccineum]
MHFLLSNMSVVYVLTTPIPDDGNDATVDQLRKRAKWDNDEYVCRGLILNGMSDSLFDVYQIVKSSKKLWDSFEAKYMAEDASSKKFLVSCIIDKLPHSWKDFKHTLKQLMEELTLVELGSHLRIEESLRALNIVNDNIGSAFMSTSKLNDSILWHARLGHVHFKRMQDMSKDGLIPAFDMDIEKCKTCMLTKITKKPFQNVKRKTKVLELIHSDLYDLYATPSLRNKKHFMTFINDASRSVVRLPDPKLKALGERGIECIFDGYAEHSKAFRFSSVPLPSQRSLVNGTKDIGCSMVHGKVTEEVVQQPEPELRKSKKNKTLEDFGPEFQLYLIEGTRDFLGKVLPQ